MQIIGNRLTCWDVVAIPPQQNKGQPHIMGDAATRTAYGTGFQAPDRFFPASAAAGQKMVKTVRGSTGKMWVLQVHGRQPCQGFWGKLPHNLSRVGHFARHDCYLRPASNELTPADEANTGRAHDSGIGKILLVSASHTEGVRARFLLH